jgi:hypothetical protein
MTDASRVSPEEIAQIIQKASEEPGINDMLAILRLSEEITDIERVNRSLTMQPVVTQAGSSTAGWVR